MSCCFQVYGKVTQLYVYIVFFRFFPIIGYFEILGLIPCDIQ